MAQNIVEYNAPENLGSVSDRASAAHITAGRRIAMQFNEAGEAVSQGFRTAGHAVAQIGDAYQAHMTHMEVSSGGLYASSLLLTKTKEWDEAIKANPNDPELQQKFLAGLEKSLDDFRSTFHTDAGQKWADSHANAIRNHFNTASTADLSTMAGVKVKSDAVGTINNLTGFVDKDASMGSMTMAGGMLQKQMQDLVDSSPNLRGAKGEVVRQELYDAGMRQITRAGIFARIRKSGGVDDGSEIADDPRFSQYVDRAERDQMVRAVQQQERLTKADERYQRQIQKDEFREKSEDTLKDITLSINQGKPITRQMINDSAKNMTAAHYEHAIRYLEAANRDEPLAQVSQQTSAEILEGMRKPYGDKDRINTLDAAYKAFFAHQLNKSDLNFLIHQYEQLKTPEGQKLGPKVNDFLNAYKGSITKSILGSQVDKSGDIRYFKFKQFVEDKVDAIRREGKNPFDLFDPGKPDYLGKKETIAPYITPLNRRLQDQMERLQGGTGNRPPIRGFGG